MSHLLLARGDSFPRSLVGRRNWKVLHPVPTSVADDWRSLLHGLLALPASNDRFALAVPPETVDVITDVKQEVEENENPGGDLYDIRDWGNKLGGQILRIAALFAMVEDALATRVEKRHAEQARVLLPYLVEHARRGFKLASSENPMISIGHRILEWMRRKQLVRFSVRDAQRALNVRKVGLLHDPLALLVERGWIREVGVPAKARGRPASPVYEVNPAAFIDRAEPKCDTDVPTQTTQPSEARAPSSSVDSVGRSTSLSDDRTPSGVPRLVTVSLFGLEVVYDDEGDVGRHVTFPGALRPIVTLGGRPHDGWILPRDDGGYQLDETTGSLVVQHRDATGADETSMNPSRHPLTEEAIDELVASFEDV